MSDKQKEEKLDPVSLSTMLGKDIFMAQGKRYNVSPIKLKDIKEFVTDKLFVPADTMSDGYGQYITMLNDKGREKLDKWIKKQVTYSDSPMSLELAYDHDWDIADIGRMLKTIVGLSG